MGTNKCFYACHIENSFLFLSIPDLWMKKLQSKHRKRVPVSVKSTFCRYAPEWNFACWEPQTFYLFHYLLQHFI